MESICLVLLPQKKKKDNNSNNLSAGGVSWKWWAGPERGLKEWVLVGTRLGHLRGLLERKSHAPCLLLPTVVPSFDCESMNNAWRMGLKEGEGWRDLGSGCGRCVGGGAQP